MALAGAREKYLPPYLREPQKPPAPEPAPAPRQQVRSLLHKAAPSFATVSSVMCLSAMRARQAAGRGGGRWSDSEAPGPGAVSYTHLTLPTIYAV